MLNQNNIQLHKDKNQFVAAIEFTAAQTGFQPELIEKDYFCSLILNDFSLQPQNNLVFKGGTLLAKAHARFYRLSEDLDFTIPISSSATRKERSQYATSVKHFVNSLSDRLPIFIIKQKLTGSNESRQYNAEIIYNSCLSEKQNRILIEIGLREKILHAPVKEKMNTLILNPFTGKNYVDHIYFPSLSLQEAYAEKMRAALTRKKLAIRDFYDLYYAIKNKIIKIDDQVFITLVKTKLLLPNVTLVEFNDEKVKFLKNRVATELMPTLNQHQSINFSLDEIISILATFSHNFLLFERNSM